jgi:hypothetical protein
MQFQGVSEYLEDLVARIDVPLLNKLKISFFHQLIFDTPQLAQFISRTPKFHAHNEALVEFYDENVSVTLRQIPDLNEMLSLVIPCRQSDWQLSSLAQLCSSSFHQALIPPVEHLHILEYNILRPQWQDDIEDSQWLELLRLFTAVKGLWISQEFVPRIAPALQELVGEGMTEVLPALQNLFLEEDLPSGPIQESIGQFVASRQLAVTVSR